jgi:hypothetical protein
MVLSYLYRALNIHTVYTNSYANEVVFLEPYHNVTFELKNSVTLAHVRHSRTVKLAEFPMFLLNCLFIIKRDIFLPMRNIGLSDRRHGNSASGVSVILTVPNSDAFPTQ